MFRLLSIFILFLGTSLAQITPYTPQTYVATWTKYSLVAIANGVNGCANANGCWQVNGVLGANKTAGVTQSVTLFSKSAGGFIELVRLKTTLAFTGTTTATGTIGTTIDDNFYTTALYDLKAAVSATNVSPVNGLMLGVGGTTTAAENVVLAIITTVENIDLIVAGSAVDIWVKMAVLP